MEAVGDVDDLAIEELLIEEPQNAGEALAAALLALALQAGLGEQVNAIPLENVKALSPSTKEESSGWHSTVMLRTWQMDSDMLALNSEWMRRSIQSGRNVIPQEQMNRFLDPQTPIDALFTKIKTLGKGAFGTTGLWRADDGTLYAIKELEPTLGNGSSDFEIGRALEDPRIVRTHNFVQKWASPKEMRRYLIMEYVDGETLRNQALPLERRVEITREMLASAIYMFRQGILPVDVHLDNLMITSDGKWKWIDLGMYQPINCADRLTLGTYFKQVARLVQRILQPDESVPITEKHFPPLQKIIEMFRDLPQYEEAMSVEFLPLLERYCNLLLNWLGLYQQSLAAQSLSSCA